MGKLKGNLLTIFDDGNVHIQLFLTEFCSQDFTIAIHYIIM